MFFPSSPISYSIEITFACSNSCHTCANVWGSQRDESLDNWKYLIDRIAPFENRRKYSDLFIITGGEPTLHKAFPQIIEYVDTLGIPHALFTTARWKNPDDIIRLYQGCQNFIGMLVSLHGSTPAAHNAFVNSDDSAFDETCQNIRRASKSGIEIFTNTVVTKHSCSQIEDIVSLSKELGATYAVFNRLLGPENALTPSESQLKEAVLLIEALQDRGADCRIGNCVPKCFVENSSEGSNAGIEHCAISPKGWVRPDNLTGYVFGNIFEQPIEDIWQSDQAQWYREQIPNACLDCAELPRCRGGARSVTIEHGLETDPLMKTPIRESAPETIVFDPELKPVPYYTLREEPFGYLIARYNWSVPVSPEAKPILDAINGKNTLAEIEKQFGGEGLNFVGYLYQEKCIGFEE